MAVPASARSNANAIHLFRQRKANDNPLRKIWMTYPVEILPAHLEEMIDRGYLPAEDVNDKRKRTDAYQKWVAELWARAPKNK